MEVPSQTKKRLSSKIIAVTQYLLLLVLYSFVTFGGRNSDPYFSLFTLDQWLSDDDYAFESSFNSASSLSDVWDSVENSFMPGLFPTTSSDGKSLSDWEQFFLADGKNMRIGAVRLRLVRVKSLYCNAPSGTLSPGAQCYPQYYTCTFNRECLHATNKYTPPNSNESYAYLETNQAGYRAPQTRLGYSGSGYVVDFGGTPSIINGTRMGERIAAQVSMLRKQQWIDEAARAFFIEFNTFNPNTGMMSNARFCAEFLGTGGVRTSYRIESAPLLRYLRVLSGDPVSYWHRLLVLAEAVFFVYTFFYMWTEFLRLKKQAQAVADYDHQAQGMAHPERTLGTRPRGYFQVGWNVVIWTALVLIFIQLCIKVGQLFGTMYLDLTNFSDYNEDLQSLLSWERTSDSVNAFIAFLLFLTFFRDISHLPFISQYTETLVRAAEDMSIFGLVLLAGLIFFGLAFLLAFGTGVQDYRDLLVSVCSLFRTVLGDFDLDSISRQNYVLGPFLFVFFIIVMFFVVLSMVLAIVAAAFQKTREAHLKALVEGHHHTDELFQDLLLLWNRAAAFIGSAVRDLSRPSSGQGNDGGASVGDGEGASSLDGEQAGAAGSVPGDLGSPTPQLPAIPLVQACSSSEAHLAYAATYHSAFTEVKEAEEHQDKLNEILARISSQLTKAEQALEEEREKAGTGEFK